MAAKYGRQRILKLRPSQRQQTLRATLDWSFGLLSEAERTVFSRLSVFAGGCTLASE